VDAVIKLLNSHLLGKELLIRFTVRVFRKHVNLCTCTSFPIGFKSGMWDLIVLIPEHCLSFYFTVIV
ncbi:MAG: hypothetical protein AB2693_27840, partial [Candidatus Thiodiazotropha sp.]